MFESVKNSVKGTYVASNNNVFDAGLQKYMTSVYNQMGLAILVTAVVASVVSRNDFLMRLIFSNTLLFWAISLIPIGFAIYMQSRIETIKLQSAYMIFYLYAASIGISCSILFLAYTGQSIARCFLITAGLFGWMSFYGYTTKKDLTSIGGVLVAGLWGAIIFSIINIFIGSTAFETVLSLVIIGIFVGLIAYDTQSIRRAYYLLPEEGDMKSKFAVVSALSLYLDFINIFIQLMYLLGDRRK